MKTQPHSKTKWNGRLVLLVTVAISVLGAAVYLGFYGVPDTPVAEGPDQDKASQKPGLPSEKALALKTDLAALNACFVRLYDANLPSDTKDRALRQEQLGVAHCLHDAFKQDAHTLFILAMAYQEQGQSVKAVEYLIECLKLQPDRADAYDQLGRIAQQKGDHEKAVALFREAATHDPNMPGIHYRLAEMLQAQGELQQALIEIEQHTRLNPQRPEGFILWGQISLQRQAYAQAKVAYEKAIQLNPDLPKPYFSLATVCARLGLKEASQDYRLRFKEAELAQRQAAKDLRQSFDPLGITSESVAHTHTDVARIYQAHGKPGQASLLYQRARMLDPNNITSSIELADLLLRSGQLTEALAAYQRVVDIQPNQGVAHFFIGHIHEKLAQWEDAEGAYLKVIEVTPDRPEGYQALARFYLERDFSVSRVRDLVDQAIILNPIAENYYLLAQTCDRLKECDEALRAVERAIKLAPGHLEYYQFHQRMRELK
ncbi:MAG: tetratricopeptide repeat protein [Phycisphaeraceae bacterium]|nr:tetratricopeptide repeat protein [Phycisphaeraceae bacterium]